MSHSRLVTRTENSRNFEYSNSSRGGGYIDYFKLTKMLLGGIKSMWPQMGGKQRTVTMLSLVYKLPWWLLIKPLGSLFKTKDQYIGRLEVITEDGILLKRKFMRAHKKFTFYFTILPLWHWERKFFTAEEQEMLAKKYRD